MASANQTRLRSTSRISLIIAVVLLVCGGLLLNTTASRFERYSVMSHWPETQAVVTASGVIGDRAFRPNVVFTYQVDGTPYVDSSDLAMPSFGGRNNRREAADTMASMYPVGAAVTIHYDPDNPSDAKMKVSPPFSVYMQLSVGIILIALGFLAGMVSVRLKAERILRS